jgi:hypothetical protein
MEGKSRRLESLTIGHINVVQKMSFTYAGEDGVIRTAGPWGVHFDYSFFNSTQLTTVS